MKKLFLSFALSLLTMVTFAQYTYHAPILLHDQDGLVISGDSIRPGSGVVGIYIYNSKNVTVTDVKIYGPASGTYMPAVRFDNCTNCKVTYSYVEGTGMAVYAFNSHSIKADYNQVKNIKGPGGAIQFNTVNGPNSSISYNIVDLFPYGAGTNPKPNVGDLLNFYKCNGTPTSPMQMIGNWLRGGGTSTVLFAGIIAGDVNGSYQYIARNRLVATGYAGIQQQSGTHIVVEGNLIQSDAYPWSGAGLVSANYSDKPSFDVTFINNKVNWKAGKFGGVNRDSVYKPANANPLPFGFRTRNTYKAAITPSILPSVIITKH